MNLAGAFGLAAALCMVAASMFGGRGLVWDRGKAWGRPDDIPALVRAISKGSSAVRFAGLTFNAPDPSGPDEPVNLNLSFENGKAGFNWVLLAPRNIKEEKFKAFAHARGIEPRPCSMNGVSYLRVEDCDVAKFATNVITEMYGRAPDEPLALFHEGFEWPRS